MVFCLDEFGPLNLQPHPGRQWADRGPRPRRRATCTRPHGVPHLFAAYDLACDKLYGHVKKTENRTRLLEFRTSTYVQSSTGRTLSDAASRPW
ncbi:hypothetical protein [Umezawaea sp. Da 62-37]|uniref:hypothetical protein n=1 Tax=Umezawaea sp. Da 62-37 TaxID=3075927 RepID=UPI0028F6E856|nr:hypothetical protein [Umezawaea sp. Da 62-37]WNV82376.1 hypothetical protein RM788_29725 [Umezawaea sp. Da 62-37]